MTLNADQQREILRWTKNMSRERERIRTMSKSGFVSNQKRAVILKEQEARFCEFLKEL